VASADVELVWRGIEQANPWWSTGSVPTARTAAFEREAFPTIFEALKRSEVGRGVVVLGPRRIGKTVLLHQVVAKLLKEGVDPKGICFLSLDDVALRDRDLGELLDLVTVRRPWTSDRPRFLLLDEIQHSKAWAGWLKRLTDRRDPYVFLATGSSATALRRGGQDAGLGRWREMTLFPWSFREHVKIRNLSTWSFAWLDHGAEYAHRQADGGLGDAQLAERVRALGPTPPADEMANLDAALIDYFVRGGFPEVATESDVREARRKLRQDILERSLGRDITDVANVDTRLLERLFIRICLNPGGLWNEVEAGRDLGVSRPTIARYLQILEEAFLVFRLPNLASPVKGQPKVYPVAPSMRQALLALDEDDVRRPDDWGRIAENAVAAAAVGTSPDASQVGFWRKNDECDVVILRDGAISEFIEVKRSGQKAFRGIDHAAEALGRNGLKAFGIVLCNELRGSDPFAETPGGVHCLKQPVAVWLYGRSAQAGGTLRVEV
jgi:predicted AAA+ superfamily ATPase